MSRLRRIRSPFIPIIAPSASERVVVSVERLVKGLMFQCSMCGNCIHLPDVLSKGVAEWAVWRPAPRIGSGRLPRPMSRGQSKRRGSSEAQTSAWRGRRLARGAPTIPATRACVLDSRTALGYYLHNFEYWHL